MVNFLKLDQVNKVKNRRVLLNLVFQQTLTCASRPYPAIVAGIWTNFIPSLQKCNLRDDYSWVQGQYCPDISSPIEESLTKDPRTFWNTAKTIALTSGNSTFGNKVATDPQGMNELFVEVFSSVFRTPNSEVPDYPHRTDLNL
ncbi:hypothetical protein J6590_018455 [Homalodisca vitripennis]|nr:hypothetical protein J6590_018455 [Homalodisca vitripennis]